MDTRHLETFLIAAKCENFRQAAREQGLSQPAVTQQIRTLEREFGFTLFRKSGRGIQLTEAGKILAQNAHMLLGELKKFQSTADLLRRNELGTIAIGYSTSLMSEDHLPRVLRQFAEAHPAIELTVSPMRVTDAIEALIDRKIDLAVVRAPLPSLPPVLDVHGFDRSNLVLAVPLGHPLVRGQHVDWQELAEVQMLSIRDSQGVGLREVTEKLLHQHGVKPTKMRLVADMTSLVGLVTANVGVAILPEAIARAHRGVTVLSIGSANYFIESVVVAHREIVTIPTKHLFARLVAAG
ncbi:LysR family transcriptional regulator [Neorhizobium sp. JUb45]|uniref:LysR family transcriptional regulator n=1 Tax=Neorhizobium sp. JUb45 TaxID=2485113 RepID=UPI001050CCFE|nr:LysR family transcriptional regulator [Neorhizobium sp. JUb45]TCQ99445.1 LysR family transcriptional regulator [Neorhizobium sp. JUb45]